MKVNFSLFAWYFWGKKFFRKCQGEVLYFKSVKELDFFDFWTFENWFLWYKLCVSQKSPILETYSIFAKQFHRWKIFFSPKTDKYLSQILQKNCNPYSWAVFAKRKNREPTRHFNRHRFPSFIIKNPHKRWISILVAFLFC